MDSSKAKAKNYKQPSLNEFFKDSAPKAETYLEPKHKVTKETKKSNTFKHENEDEISFIDDKKKM